MLTLSLYASTPVCCFSPAVSFGITGKGYVLFASDTSAARSIVRMKSDEDKQKVIGKHLVMACKSGSRPRTDLPRLTSCVATDSGEPGDTVQFAEYVERNLRLYQIRSVCPEISLMFPHADDAATGASLHGHATAITCH